jgi:hypothetical protein
VLFYEFDANLPTWEETKRSVLLKLSAEGEEEWRTYLGDWEDYRIDPGGIVEVGGEIIVSYTDTDYWDDGSGQYEYYSSNTVHLVHYDLDGALLDEVSLLDEIPNSVLSPGRHRYEISQMQLLDDGNLLITGTTNVGALLIKTTVASEVIWDREHFYLPLNLNVDEQDNYIYHALPTSDGGFLCTGEYLHYPVPGNPTSEQSAIALKVDEYGCLLPGCQLADGLSEEVIGTLAVYPNPTIGDLRVVLPSRLSLDVRSGRIQLFDALGREIPDSRFIVQANVDSESLLLDIAALPKGLYVLRLTSAYGVYAARILKE